MFATISAIVTKAMPPLGSRSSPIGNMIAPDAGRYSPAICVFSATLSSANCWTIERRPV